MRYKPSKIEKKWQKKWLSNRLYEPDLKRAKKPFYNLTMFPYPSAEGLHVGNMYDMVGCDILGRLKRMQGYDVFQPIGLDGFGIHSENYAIKVGRHPAEQAKISEKNFYRQLLLIGNGFAWNERLETYDPDYYKWTQWIFAQMYKRGLACRKKASVNWCPSCKTVLADEQVIAGKCERCSSVVIKKELEQWFFKITDYAERLLKNLEKIDWSEKIKIAQRNWIGKSEGAEIEFRIKNQESRIKVFTTRPDTLFGTTYMVVAPEHLIIQNLESKIKNLEEVKEYIKSAKNKSEEDRIAEEREKTGVELKGIKVINPANGEEIPIFVADYVLGNVGTGAIMAVPAHDQRDWEFATKFNLPAVMVVCPNYPDKTCPVLEKAYEGKGHLVASGKFNGKDSEVAKWEITKFVGGERKVQYRLRDWLISRQRYWGPPIPLIFCQKCAEQILNPKSEIRNKFNEAELKNPGWFAIPEKDLPVKLPYLKNFRPTGTDKSPLAADEKFCKVRCPKCKSWARRETDVSDTFLDSAWYYYRYIDDRNKREIFGKERMKKWLPVDWYMGGFEHAVLHLLYTRFITMVFCDWKLIPFDEPFKVFRAHGHIIKDGAKMSKSRGNVINPDEYIRAYGADALRMYLMFLGPFEEGGDFRDTGIRGVTRFLERVWKFAAQLKKNQVSEPAGEVSKTLHKTIQKVTSDLENLQYNTAVSSLMILLNTFEENPQGVTMKVFADFLKLLAPFAPHLTEELWSSLLRNKKSIHIQSWPAFDPELVREKFAEVVVQINGKFRGVIRLAVGAGQKEAENQARKSEEIKKHLTGEARKIIFVPDRLINFVL